MLDHFCTIICSNFSSTCWSNFAPHIVQHLYNICAVFCTTNMSCKCVRLNRWPVRGEWWPGSDPRKWRSLARWGNGPHLHLNRHHPDNQLAVYLYQNYSQHTHSPYHPYNHWQSSSDSLRKTSQFKTEGTSRGTMRILGELDMNCGAEVNYCVLLCAVVK